MAQLEGLKLYKIRDLCVLLDVSTDRLPIKCNFCKKFLQLVDKLNFDFTDLVVLWREGIPYGACCFCIRKLATYEYLRYFESTFNPRNVELLLGIPFRAVNVRCQYCLKSLSQEEKSRIQLQQRAVYRVRGAWRSGCDYCNVRDSSDASGHCASGSS